MNIVGQISAVVDASTKFVWSVFTACIVALVVAQWNSNLFEGLPLWVFPSLHLMAILTGILAAFTLFSPLMRLIRWVINLVLRPKRRKRIRRNLLALSAPELLYLCLALSKMDRSCRLNGDDPVVISLLDRQLLRRYFGGAVYSDGRSGFRVPETVWREMLSMEEFLMENPEGLAKLSRWDFPNDDVILSWLPKKHPSMLEMTASEDQ